MCQEIHHYAQCRGYHGACPNKRFTSIKHVECYDSSLRDQGWGGCGDSIYQETPTETFECDVCLANQQQGRAVATAYVAGSTEKTYIDQLPEGFETSHLMVQLRSASEYGKSKKNGDQSSGSSATGGRGG